MSAFLKHFTYCRAAEAEDTLSHFQMEREKKAASPSCLFAEKKFVSLARKVGLVFFFFSLSSLEVALDCVISSSVIMLRHPDQGCLLVKLPWRKW